ncbi:class I SAM-dependent methyltransferase [Herminiimonas arsenitoxidans]|uniref:class I SAM-dependent methyltransferase n=1 Tax=Herminiimonas arsenitoxidans TaxID=1809410 RepID=UPI000970D137|nr:class I SAM-dependent methyltransferase [Herminiimonas arsenitoxidans]
MNNEELQAVFNQQAASYDSQWAKLASLRDALNLLIGAVLSNLPTDARILSIGTGTGTEILSLAEKFPEWHFTAVEPSGSMLDVFRRKAEEQGIASRCTFHEGYLNSLPESEAFHAATSLLVSQFILEQDDRIEFFQSIKQRLRPDGYLINSDLSSDIDSYNYQNLLEIWMRMMSGADIGHEKREQMRAAYARDVAILPQEKVGGIIAAGGFEQPTLFYQCGLIHAWVTKAKAD